MIRMLAILALVLQGITHTPRCPSIGLCRDICADMVCTAPESDADSSCASMCCLTAPNERCAGSCASMCLESGPDPEAPSPCPDEDQCRACCFVLCRFDPFAAIPDSHTGAGRHSTPEVALAWFLACAPSYPAITGAPTVQRIAVAGGVHAPRVPISSRPIICVWTI